MTNTSLHTQLIKREADRLGFSFTGISRARRLDEEADRLESWLKRGLHGQMSYMENHFDKRLDPTLLVPGAKSVISLMYNYYPAQEQQDPQAPKIARYAYGSDYHHILKPRLKTLLQFIEENIGAVDARVFVDSAPVMERSWAAQSGLGWVGKNTLLLNKKSGSYHFLAEIICDLELEYDGPATDHCGTCTACIDACPTDAITPYEVNASKCISYLTIELRDEIPAEFAGKMDNWAFGCDICQEVCPWNRFAKPHNEPAFNPHPDLLTMNHDEWHALSEEHFRIIFKHSAVKRTKYEGLKRNLKFLKKD